MRIIYFLRQMRGYIHFGKRIHFHGNVKYGNRKNISFGSDCSLNEGVYILGRNKTTIGNRVTLSARAMLLDSGLDLASVERKHIGESIEIQDDVWIGAGAIVLPGVIVGHGSVIGAGSVVTKSIPANSLAAGNPAVVIRTLAQKLV